VRTTLKRGIGRGASANGDGRAILPPGALTPVRRYQQPARPQPRLRLVGKVGLWIVGVIVMLAGSIGGGAYLFFHHSIGATAPKTAPDIYASKHGLAKQVSLSRPAIALVIGYDRRYKEAGNSRSDTVMLIRTNPSPKAISLLSFPRDLRVDVKCPGHDYGYDKLNAAYSFCNSPGTLWTIRNLTGLPVNYLIKVDFRGFQQVVDKLGGVWMDVDRRYYHSNAGTALNSENRYAEINLVPGYQRLNGSQALSFVRYRHTDNDVYRNARQQQFVKAVRQQLSNVSFTDITGIASIVGAITRNVVIGKAGGGAPDDQTVLNYALFALALPHGNVFQVKIPNLVLGPSDVTASPASIQEAVDEFQHPNVSAAEETGSAVLHHRIGKKPKGLSPHKITVNVLNGNGVQGAAATGAAALDERGYRIVYPPGGKPADAPRHNYFDTVVYFDPSQKHAKAGAKQIQNLFGSAVVQPIAKGPAIRPLSNGAMVVVVVGTTFHGRLAPGPVYKPPPKPEPPAVVRNAGATIGLLRSRQHRVPFKLEVPTLIEQSSSPDSDMPIDVYKIHGDDKAVRLTFRMANGLEFWGIEETSWTDAPVLGDANFKHTIKGRDYYFYFNGQHLHMVVLRENGASYWVVNTLLDSLSPATMISIAKGLHPLGTTHHRRHHHKKKK
jgi:LCP family protein required for cell wall assembly